MTREKLEEFRQKKIAEKSKKERVEEMEVFLEKLSDFGEIYFSNDTLGKQMTREEILAMKPGRELDALVFKFVMGGHIPKPPFRANFMKYSSDITAAWGIVERFKSKGYLFSLKNLVGGNYEFTLTDWVGKCDIYSAQGDTPQEAICKAALYAVTHYAEINLPNQRER